MCRFGCWAARTTLRSSVNWRIRPPCGSCAAGALETYPLTPGPATISGANTNIIGQSVRTRRPLPPRVVCRGVGLDRQSSCGELDDGRSSPFHPLPATPSHRRFRLSSDPADQAVRAVHCWFGRQCAGPAAASEQFDRQQQRRRPAMAPPGRPGAAVSGQRPPEVTRSRPAPGLPARHSSLESAPDHPSHCAPSPAPIYDCTTHRHPAWCTAQRARLN